MPDVLADRRELARTMFADAVVRGLKCEMMDTGMRVGNDIVGDG